MFPAAGASLSEYVRFRAYYRCEEFPPGWDPSSPARPEPEAPAPDAGLPPGRYSTGSDGSGVGQPARARPPALTLARFTDDLRSPALVERAFGRGRVLLFTSSVDLDWNDWARAMDGSYVVTMLELAQYAARRSQDSHSH